MIFVISPAKTLDEDQPYPPVSLSQPYFIDKAEKLMKRLRRLSSKEIMSLMKVSGQISDLNRHRFQTWSLPFTEANSRPALFLFNGDVYRGLDVATLPVASIEFSQQHLRILSGLYGLLKPMDLIQPYRLEMGTPLKISKAKTNLYQFWANDIRKKIQEDIKISGSNVLVNLASQEYFKAIEAKKLKAKIVDVDFREERNGKLVTVSIFAKRARGLMSRYILENFITNPTDLISFQEEGYTFAPHHSKEEHLIFTRKS